PLHAVVLACALRLYADSRSPIFIAAGGVTAALTLSLLVAAIGSQSVYPREGSVGMWCAIGLMMRVWVERTRVLGASHQEGKARANTSSAVLALGRGR